MKIEEHVLEVLRECTTEGNILFLPDRQLDRKLYLDVNKYLEAIGGKWSRKDKGHVFDHDPADDLEEMINTGEVTDRKKELQFYPTPIDIVYKLNSLAKQMYIGDYLAADWCEPSVGTGNILSQFPGTAKITVMDIDEKLLETCKAKNYAPNITYLVQDFLTWHGKADIIVMNPPFTKQQDLKHFFHAVDCLNPGGVLVSVMSESPFFRTTDLARNFRSFIDGTNAIIEDLPIGAFKESGTMVKTRIVGIRK